MGGEWRIRGPPYSYLRFDRPFFTGYGPNFCLLFDRIGARQPGIAASTGTTPGRSGLVVVRSSVCWAVVDLRFMVGCAAGFCDPPEGGDSELSPGTWWHRHHAVVPSSNAARPSA